MRINRPKGGSLRVAGGAIYGKIGKQALLYSYQAFYPLQKRSMQQFISSMKDKSIKYMYDMRYNGVKGVFEGIQFKHVVNNNLSCDCNITINKQQQEIEYLKKQLAELQSLLKSKDEVSPKKKQKNVTKEESKIEIIEPTSLFSNEDLEESFNESFDSAVSSRIVSHTHRSFFT